jgi:hypothetical protein
MLEKAEPAKYLGINSHGILTSSTSSRRQITPESFYRGTSTGVHRKLKIFAIRP